MAEPSYEELKAQLEELQKKGSAAAPEHSNSASAKREASVSMALAAFRSRSTTSSGSACWMSPPTARLS